jgi:hypothetical protein
MKLSDSEEETPENGQKKAVDAWLKRGYTAEEARIKAGVGKIIDHCTNTPNHTTDSL